MGNYSIALAPGDGIGPEVVSQAEGVLDAVGDRFGHVFHYVELIIGGRAVDLTGEPLPGETLDAAKRCDAVLLGAVGGPAWDALPGRLRPERALLGLRSGLGVFANLRPAKLLPQLRDACPLKEEALAAGSDDGRPGFDILIVRELTGGIYFGKQGRSADGAAAFDTETYSRMEIERLLRVGYAAARLRRGKLCVVDKANVLESSRLWRETAGELAGEYPDVETSYLYVDNCAMQLIRSPGRFDVLATSNMFGDILSDEASELTGSIGMLASASLTGIGGKAGGGPVMGVYEPVHGAAPDIAGRDIANPLAAILSAALLLRYSLGLETEASAIEAAAAAVLDQGLRTQDIARRGGGGTAEKIIGTAEMGKAVVEQITSSR